jgi:Replication protein
MGNIYTLADNGTNKAGQDHVIVNGKGSDLNNIKALHGRAKRKTITQIMMLNLIKIARENGEPELEKSYWNTYYCQQNLITADGKLYGKYCKNRFCTLCCSIRKAEIINKYHPVMKNWQDPYFVTLTVKSCKANQLDKYIKSMQKTFRQIVEKHRKRYQRGNGLKLIGVKSLECNFNPAEKWYNPHFHLIVKEKWMAEVIVNEWLERSKPDYTLKWCQNIQKVTDLEKGLIEIIKYGSKIFTEPDLKNRAKETETSYIYLKALDIILTAMKGKRIFDRFGFNLPAKTNSAITPAKLLADFQEWEYDIEVSNWINTATGEILSDYKIPSHLQSILENNLDTLSK